MSTGTYIRDRALTGDIVACRDNTVVDRVIKLITRGSFTHVAVYVGDGLIIESHWLGLRFTQLKSKRGEYDLYRVPRLTPEQRLGTVRFMARRVDSKYDFKLLLATGVKLVTGIRLPLDDPNRYICSEIIIDALRANGVKVEDELDPDKFVRQFERIW